MQLFYGEELGSLKCYLSIFCSLKAEDKSFDRDERVQIVLHNTLGFHEYRRVTRSKLKIVFNIGMVLYLTGSIYHAHNCVCKLYSKVIYIHN